MVAGAACVLVATSAAAQDPPPAAPPAARAEPSTEPFQARVRMLHGADLLLLQDGRRVRLQGLSLPTPAVRSAALVRELKEFLQARVEARAMWIHPVPGLPPDDGADLVAVVRPMREGPSLNEQALARGLALLDLSTCDVGERAALAAAAARAQAVRAGWFGREPARALVPPPGAGAVLPLRGVTLRVSGERGADDHRALDALAAAGVRDVQLLCVALLDDARAHRIDWHDGCSAGDERLLDVMQHARARGLAVMLRPVLVLREGACGTLRPHDEARFWQQYDAFACHCADLAEADGAGAIAIGSELDALEDRGDEWRRVIGNVRGRFRGRVTHVVRLEHARVPQFLDAVDYVGVSGCASSSTDLDAAWRRAAALLRACHERTGKELVVIDVDAVDAAESVAGSTWLLQRADWRAVFAAAAAEMPFVRGGYLAPRLPAEAADDRWREAWQGWASASK